MYKRQEFNRLLSISEGNALESELNLLQQWKENRVEKQENALLDGIYESVNNGEAVETLSLIHILFNFIKSS